jgi:hypothetical protein
MSSDDLTLGVKQYMNSTAPAEEEDNTFIFWQKQQFSFLALRFINF